MARISEFSKEFKDAGGHAPKNSQVIELLEGYGAGQKTASSNVPEEYEKKLTEDLKAQGYTRGGAAAGKPAEKPAQTTEKENMNKDKANTGKPEAKQPAKEAVQKSAPVKAAAAQEQAKPAAAGRSEAQPARQQNQQPPRKKKTIIITGGNVGGAARPNYPKNGGHPQANHMNRGPIRPRENMIDRAGAITNRRLEEERAQEEAQRRQEEAERAKAAAQAQAQKAAEVQETRPAEQPAPVRNENAGRQSGNGQRPQGASGSRPAQGGMGRNDRPQGQGDRFQRGERPQNGGRPGQGGAFQRTDRPGQGGGRPSQGGGFQRGDRPQNGGRPGTGFGGGRPGQGGKPQGGGRGFAAAPVVESKNDNRRSKHNDKDRDREQRKNSSFYEDNVGRGRNSRAGSFIKPEAKKQEKAEDEIKVVTLPESITVKDLAEKMRVQPSEVVKKLFLQGEMVTLNQEISFEKAEEIALDYEIMCEQEEKVDVIAELLKEEEEEESTLVERPPVICVMGHVDHGKTSLLDAIRKTNVTEREAGGITQHIGAYTVKVNDRVITFLDTPGHEAFTSMRMRGANSTDIAILVVAADDGVMPQTIEAINHAKAAGIEIIVAVNKIDKPGANIDRVKQELTEYELVAEDWGGSTIFAPVSAKTGEGIDNLLEMILLSADVLELKANPKRQARGLVIEAELDKGRGPVATVLVQKGTLHVGDFISAGAAHGKVRAMVDDKGRRVKEAGPSMPVEILGLNDVPNAGEIFIAHKNDKEAKSFADTFIAQNRVKMLEDTKAKMSLEDVFSKIQEGNLKELNLIIKADVQGSVEAVKQSLLKLSNDEVVVKVIHGGVGAINESDVVLASASNAIIIGFNVRPDAMAKQTAEREGVDVRLYKVIYQAIEDIEAAMKGMLDPIFEEKVIGHAEVRQIFKASAVGNIAGSFVLDGVFQRDCKIRISREGEQIYEGSLASLKRFKDDVKEVKAGFECGLVFEGFDQMQELDQVEAYIMVEVPRN
ncbi:MAG: translation initiation factor IF-2 [Lachnospiraceae bacterium]|nr:translation initiation factor IF-2 [Lachnospiraceae bacterium]